MHLIVVNMGTPGAVIHKKYGTFGQWFERAYKSIDETILVDSFEVEDVDLEDLLECDGVILSGAEENVEDQLEKHIGFKGHMQSLIDYQQPLLGVCFSHQYLADFLGGEVSAPEGKDQWGNCVIRLNENGQQDPLFIGIPENAFFIESHFQMVATPPPGATVLAYDDDVAVQAFRYGSAVWGVQFHPEMTSGIIMSIIDEQEHLEEERKEKLKAEAQNPHDGLLLLNNFARICEEMKKQRESSSS